MEGVMQLKFRSFYDLRVTDVKKNDLTRAFLSLPDLRAMDEKNSNSTTTFLSSDSRKSAKAMDASKKNVSGSKFLSLTNSWGPAVQAGSPQKENSLLDGLTAARRAIRSLWKKTKKFTTNRAQRISRSICFCPVFL